MEQNTQKKSSTREWFDALLIAFILAMIIRSFLLQAYRIPSSSMEDTLLKGDHILATKYNYGMTMPFTTHKLWGKDRVPERGDVVIFTFPPDHSKDFVKRVIGLPGDTLYVKDKIVYINGEPFSADHEKYTDSGILTEGIAGVRDNMDPITVQQGHVFVMGDNRDQSYDSRFWGQVPVEFIKGKAFILYFSWDKEGNKVRISRFGRLVK